MLVPVLHTSGRTGTDGTPASASPRPERGPEWYDSRAEPLHSPQDRLAESVGLAEAIELDVIAKLLVPVARPAARNGCLAQARSTSSKS